MWVCVSNSHSLSLWQAIRAESELEFCAADCRAGRPKIARAEMSWGGGRFGWYSEGGRGIFRLPAAEGGGGAGGRERDEG